MALPCLPRLAPGVGLCRPVLIVRDLILHMPSRRCVDPKRGIVYGALGAPIGHACADGYVRLGQRPECDQYAHRLIWSIVHGPIPSGYYVDHRNGRKADNRIANLDAVTPAENAARALERGVGRFGEATSNAKLTAPIVRAIRTSTAATRELARIHGVDPATIRAVRDGTTWRHVPLRGRLPDRPKWRRRPR